MSENLEYTKYLKAYICRTCGWAEHPYAGFRQDVCPDCGEELTEAVGRYQMHTKKGWFGSSSLINYKFFEKKK